MKSKVCYVPVGADTSCFASRAAIANGCHAAAAAAALHASSSCQCQQEKRVVMQLMRGSDSQESSRKRTGTAGAKSTHANAATTPTTNNTAIMDSIYPVAEDSRKDCCSLLPTLPSSSSAVSSLDTTSAASLHEKSNLLRPAANQSPASCPLHNLDQRAACSLHDLPNLRTHCGTGMEIPLNSEGVITPFCACQEAGEPYPPRAGRRIFSASSQRYYELGGPIGRGSASVVVTAQQVCQDPASNVWYYTGPTVAAKVVNLRDAAFSRQKEHEWSRVRQEIQILRSLRHPNIVELFDICETSEEIFLILELIPHGELFWQIIASDTLPEDLTRLLALQVASALSYIHRQRVMHRDLKPENLLVVRDDRTGFFRVKVADFGLAKVLHYGSAHSFVGTPQYWAPEVLASSVSGGGYDTAADVWSFGCILYVCLSGTYPFDKADCRAGRFREPQFDTPGFRTVSAEAKDAIRGLLRVDPRKRLTLREFVFHPWLHKWRPNPSQYPIWAWPTLFGYNAREAAAFLEGPLLDYFENRLGTTHPQTLERLKNPHTITPSNLVGMVTQSFVNALFDEGLIPPAALGGRKLVHRIPGGVPTAAAALVRNGLLGGGGIVPPVQGLQQQLQLPQLQLQQFQQQFQQQQLLQQQPQHMNRSPLVLPNVAAAYAVWQRLLQEAQLQQKQQQLQVACRHHPQPDVVGAMSPSGLCEILQQLQAQQAALLQRQERLLRLQEEHFANLKWHDKQLQYRQREFDRQVQIYQKSNHGSAVLLAVRRRSA